MRLLEPRRHAADERCACARRACVHRQIVLRGYIQGTLSSWETAILNTNVTTRDDLAPGLCGRVPTAAELEQAKVYDCRMPAVDQKYDEENLYRGGWFKSTQLTYDPVGAAAFAVELLNFTEMQSPYPETPEQMADTGCTSVARETRWALTWVESNATTHPFWLHFVNSNSTATEKGQLQPTTFMRDIVSRRRRTADVFDVWMYNSLVIAVDSLVPYKTKLRESARSRQPDTPTPVCHVSLSLCACSDGPEY